MVTKQITFSSSGINYTATRQDIFMDNGAQVIFIRQGKYADPAGPRVGISTKEWARIKPHLLKIDYEQYFGRKPLMKDVYIYQVNQ